MNENQVLRLPPGADEAGPPPAWDLAAAADGRPTLTTWRHYTKDSPLLESGLLGPVLLRPGVVRDVR